MKQELYVFWNKDTKRVKIGVSSDVDRRRSDIENTSGCKLSVRYRSGFLDNAVRYERLVHAEFSNHRHVGEWFNVNYKDVVECCIELLPEVSLSSREVLHKYVGNSMSIDLEGLVLAAMEEYNTKNKIHYHSSGLDVSEILSMKGRGVTITEIAKYFGVSRQTIYNYLNKSEGSDELPI